MQIIITVIATLAGIALLLLLLALIIPRRYSVTVFTVIDRPKQEVFDYVRMLGNQVLYSEWLMADPDLRPKIEGRDGMTGAVLKWESFHRDKNRNVGMGEQEIKSMDGDNIRVELRLIKPMAANCRLNNHFMEKGARSTVYTCTFFAYAKYPANLPTYFFGRRFIRKAQERSLGNLKKLLEGN